MHSSLADNSLSFFDSVTTDQPHLIAAVYPSSPESGAAAIGTYGNLATLLDLDDVAALRDLLTTCLVQAGRESAPVPTPTWRPLSDDEEAEWRAGHRHYDQARETEHGVEVVYGPQDIIFDRLQRLEPTDALDIVAHDLAQDLGFA